MHILDFFLTLLSRCNPFCVFIMFLVLASVLYALAIWQVHPGGKRRKSRRPSNAYRLPSRSETRARARHSSNLFLN